MNVNYQMTTTRLMAFGISLAPGLYPIPSLRFAAGLTPRGDQAAQVYMHLLSGLLGAGDGMNWSGDIHVDPNQYLSLVYYSHLPQMLYLTWSTTT